jgi:hypothetical protein
LEVTPLTTLVELLFNQVNRLTWRDLLTAPIFEEQGNVEDVSMDAFISEVMQVRNSRFSPTEILAIFVILV